MVFTAQCVLAGFTATVAQRGVAMAQSSLRQDSLRATCMGSMLHHTG